MEPIYYHISISSAALEIFPSWGRIENFSFPKIFHSRQSCKFCTIHHLQSEHLLFCVSQHQAWLQDSLLQRGSCLCCSCQRQARVDGDLARHRGKLHNNCSQSERAHREHAMRPMDVLRSLVGSLQVWHSLQFPESEKYMLMDLTMWTWRLDQKCNLLQRW